MPGGALAGMKDNWIYVQEPDVKVGRLQIFNNWSPYLVADPDTVWVGMEYFANEGDELWSKPSEEFAQFAIDELARSASSARDDVLDHTVIRVPKAYPAYFGTYDASPSCASTSTASRTCSSSGAMGCTATTIRITRCSPRWSRSRTSPRT